MEGPGLTDWTNLFLAGQVGIAMTRAWQVARRGILLNTVWSLWGLCRDSSFSDSALCQKSVPWQATARKGATAILSAGK